MMACHLTAAKTALRQPLHCVKFRLMVLVIAGTDPAIHPLPEDRSLDHSAQLIVGPRFAHTRLRRAGGDAEPIIQIVSIVTPAQLCTNQVAEQYHESAPRSGMTWR